MRTLNKRVRPDNISNDVRATHGSFGRIFYLVLLGGFCLGIANYVFGDIVIFRADGLVLSDENVIATTFVARVVKVDVTQGETVSKNAPLLQLLSFEILERLADLSIKRAELIAKTTEFRVRTETVAQLLPLAERREEEAGRVIEQFDSMAKGGFVRTASYAQALSANYTARRDRVTLSAEGSVLSEGMTALQLALGDADTALLDLKTNYAKGLVVSPTTGSVGALVPYVGNVYRPGEPLMSIYSGEPYVLVYLPRSYLFSVYLGMSLWVTDGQHTTPGKISEILPVTAMLPKEFQNTFQPTGRNQLAKIRLDPGSPFPLHQKVTVARSYF